MNTGAQLSPSGAFAGELTSTARYGWEHLDSQRRLNGEVLWENRRII